ncbi:hypothetical protein [Streptomyces sp. VNUA74]|uniref:Acg family FMN-binding oxidoreductase n=1 Tax=Streptomyces sp. VNUA74 TaxID=3062685 RepID=UPI00280BBCFB|nr:hypothetical protein [Streptomyces sp. VNUA74]WML79036.1 hypothetical protein Q3101_03950 [Streptomyces sp. VNUA74]
MTSPTLDAPALERLISAAVAAPSLHDTHPWRFGLEPDTCTLEFRATAARALPRAAPAARAVHLAVGCAVFNLRVAAVHLGWEPVTVLLPRPDRPDLLATVRLADATRRTVAPGSYDALWHRHSSRFPFSGVALPMSLCGELAGAARTEGADLLFTGHRETERVLSATREGERRNRKHLAHAADRHRLPRGPTGPQAAWHRRPSPALGAHHRPDVLPARPLERPPQLAVLTTAHDRRKDWLRAGQALERVLLLATASGVRASLLYQAVEWADLRGRLGGLTHPCRARPQMVIRLGYGPEGSLSSRHGADGVRPG